MQMTQEFEVAVPRETAFPFLRDVRSLAPCLPGVSDLQELEDDRYSAVVEVAVAFFKLKFNVQVEVVESKSPEWLRAKLSGKPMALAGQLTMTADLTLTESAPGHTLVSYVLDLTLTGKLGAIGQSAFRAKADEMGKKFAENMKGALEGASTVG